MRVGLVHLKRRQPMHYEFFLALTAGLSWLLFIMMP